MTEGYGIGGGSWLAGLEVKVQALEDVAGSMTHQAKIVEQGLDIKVIEGFILEISVMHQFCGAPG